MKNGPCRCRDGRCNELARCYRDGNLAAGNLIIKQFQCLVGKIVSRVLGSERREEWEDAAQVAMLHGLLVVGKWRGDCPFCCFFAGVVARKCIDIVRHLNVSHHERLGNEPECLDHPIAEMREFLMQYEAALREFPEDYRLTWQLYTEEVAIAEIAAKTGVGKRAVQYRLAYIRSRLSETLGEFGPPGLDGRENHCRVFLRARLS